MHIRPPVSGRNVTNLSLALLKVWEQPNRLPVELTDTRTRSAVEKKTLCNNTFEHIISTIHETPWLSGLSEEGNYERI